MALAASSQEVMFLRQLLPTIGYSIVGPTITFEDNESCISLASNDMTTSKSKHIDIKYHYIRDLIKQGSIAIIWCPTDDMVADILTKFVFLLLIHRKHALRMLSGTFSGPGPTGGVLVLLYTCVSPMGSVGTPVPCCAYPSYASMFLTLSRMNVPSQGHLSLCLI